MANLTLAIFLFIVLFIGVSFWLSSTTHHGEEIEVPDLTGYTLDEAQNTLTEHEMLFKVIDSAEYSADLPLGSVVRQFPTPGSFVKKSRVVMLTINPFVVRKYALPNVLEKTLRRAVYDLESKGFTVGTLTYKPDIAKDVILQIKINDQEVFAGDKYEKGTVIDLIVGAGLSNEMVSIPYLKWLSLKQAELKLKSNSLNIGLAIYDEEVKDTANALVYKQNPNPTHDPRLRMGSFVDVWLTNDSTKIPNDSLMYKYQNLDLDSIQNYLDADTNNI